MAEIEETRDSLNLVQSFDPKQLVRREDLGRSFQFEEAVKPAERIIEFFRQIPIHLLSEVTAQQRDTIKQQADQFWTRIQAILSFNPTEDPNAAATRQALIDQMSGAYDKTFNTLFHIVAYLTTRQQDFTAIEREARAAAQTARKEADALQARLVATEAEAVRILTDVKATAAELGVSQQALHFGIESDAHKTEAENWQKYTIYTAIGLGAFALVTLVAGKWFLVPQTPYEAFQLGLSKVLIFVTIAFMLFLCARTLMAHRHNRIVNKHRQNALLTFNALVDAAHGEDPRDIVLTHAAACIFAAQDSGFTKAQSPNHPLIDLMPKLAAASNQG